LLRRLRRARSIIAAKIPPNALLVTPFVPGAAEQPSLTACGFGVMVTLPVLVPEGFVVGFFVVLLPEPSPSGGSGASVESSSSPVLSGECRAVMAAVSQLRLADVERLAAVDDLGGRRELATLLARLEALVRDVADAITHRYLVHSTPRRRLGDATHLPDAGA
jgi:hypothetical protein